MDTLLTTIRRITEEREAAGLLPAWPILRDLQTALPDLSVEQIREEADELVEAGLIRVGRAISYPYYELIEQSEEDLPEDL